MNINININSTIAENVKFLYTTITLPILNGFGPLNVISKKVECYVIKCAPTDDICTVTDIKE